MIRNILNQLIYLQTHQMIILSKIILFFKINLVLSKPDLSVDPQNASRQSTNSSCFNTLKQNNEFKIDLLNLDMDLINKISQKLHYSIRLKNFSIGDYAQTIDLLNVLVDTANSKDHQFQTITIEEDYYILSKEKLDILYLFLKKIEFEQLTFEKVFINDD